MISYESQLDWTINAPEIGSNFKKKSSMVYVKIEKIIFSERESSISLISIFIHSKQTKTLKSQKAF